MTLLRLEGKTVGIKGQAETLVKDTMPLLQAGVERSAQLVEGVIKRTLTGRRTGRRYRIPGTKVTYRASAPGEPPAVMRGWLRKSIGHTRASLIGTTSESFVGPMTGTGFAKAAGAPVSVNRYAGRMEFGGVNITPQGNTVRVLPRPYIRPSWAKAEPIVDRFLLRLFSTPQVGSKVGRSLVRVNTNESTGLDPSIVGIG